MPDQDHEQRRVTVAPAEDMGEQANTRLERRLERERKARLAAEAIAEKGMRELYDRQREVLLLQTVTLAANEAASIEDALQVALDEVCAYTEWPVGHAYLLADDGTGTLFSPGLWHSADPDRFATFRSVSEATRFAPGIGLPGRVLADGKPAWIMDVNKDSNFPRAKQVQGIGVKAGFGFPVLAGSEVVGVLEFFAAEAIEPNERLLQAMAHIGTQLGRVVERKRAEDMIRHLAFHDALTGLPNRALFEDRIAVALAQAHRNHQRLAVMSLDLDRFKLINDTLGHAAGDQVLKSAGERLLRHVREGDSVARMGGDEFMVLLPGAIGAEHGAKIADKIIAAFRLPFQTGVGTFHATASIGMSFYPDDSEDAETLVQNADAAMYRAKELGRNTYQLYTPAMNLKASERLALERDLRRALERDEFVVHYQPQVQVGSGQIVGTEALLRWQHPSRGLVLPGEFIPLAEETGLIVPLGEWVLRRSCRQVKAWQEAGLPPLRLAVNISMRQFQQPNFVDVIAQVLQETGLDPHFLELEITESIAMRDTDSTVQVLRKLRDMGIRISIDDFGTGYSSLKYLKDLPIHTLKIDQSFMRDLTSDPHGATIATNIIAMGHSLNLNVIAEGVETQAQLAFLKHQQCDEFQGYLLARPMPAQALERMLQQGTRPGPSAEGSKAA